MPPPVKKGAAARAKLKERTETGSINLDTAGASVELDVGHKEVVSPTRRDA
tara:strand:+ start:657 stop:809 length:153 start_codon:yes stop_codon:yes gene_type:complete